MTLSTAPPEARCAPTHHVYAREAGSRVMQAARSPRKQTGTAVRRPLESESLMPSARLALLAVREGSIVA